MNKDVNRPSGREFDKRVEILQAAESIFLQEGYGRSSMDQIQARVGGSKRTLYRYFRSKDELFVAMIEYVSGKVLDALEPDLGAAGLREQLILMGTRYLDVLLSPVGRALFRTVSAEAQHFPELAETFYRQGPAKASRLVAAVLADASNERIIQVQDPERAAAQLLGAIRGNLHLEAIFAGREPTKKELEQTVEGAVDQFLKGTNLRTVR